jgi:hypothetical protein
MQGKAICPDRGTRCHQSAGHERDPQNENTISMWMHEHFWPDEADPTHRTCSWPRPGCAFCLEVINPEPRQLENGITRYPGWLTRDSPARRLAFHLECARRHVKGKRSPTSYRRVRQEPQFLLRESGERGLSAGFWLRYVDHAFEPRKVQAPAGPLLSPSPEAGPAFPAERVLGFQGRAALRARVLDLRAATAAEPVVGSKRRSAVRATALLRLRLRRALCAEDDGRTLPPYRLPGRGALPAIRAASLAGL